MNIEWYAEVWENDGAHVRSISAAQANSFIKDMDFFRIYDTFEQFDRDSGDYYEDEDYIHFLQSVQESDMMIVYGKDSIYPGDMSAVWQLVFGEEVSYSRS